MSRRALLTRTNLLGAILFTIHLADDIVRGFEKGGLLNLIALPIIALWLYGALILTNRRSGYAITLLGSLLSLGIPFIHMKGKGVGLEGSIANTDGALFFTSVLLGMGVTGLFGAILSAHALKNPPWLDNESR